MTREEVINLIDNYKSPEERSKLKEFFSDKTRLTSDKRTIVFSTPSETGTSYFRLFTPMCAMYKYTDDFNLIYTEQMDPSLFEVADLLIFHRAGDRHNHFYNVIKKYPREKIKPVIITDVDDNEFNLPASHPMKSMWLAAEKDKMSLKSLRESDHVNTTTRKLESTFKGFNKNVKIFKNKFNWNLPQWNIDKKEKLERFGDKIVIGWAGLTSHYNDILKMKPILKDIYNKFSNIHFVLAGMALADKKYEIQVDPNTGKKIIKELDIKDDEETYRIKIEKLFSDFDSSRITIENALPLEEYARFYSWFDIGLAFIEHNAFNSCKSEIKVVEYCKYGAIPIFSDYGGYRDFDQSIQSNDIYKEYRDKLLCNYETKDEWVSKISYWIEKLMSNKKEFYNISNELKSYVEKEYMIDNDIDDRTQYYSSLIERNIEKELERINK
jgi:hypothetical protein